MNKWYKNIIGARTIKTGVATFFTTVFCMLLNLTPIFAILTAIVTIEPTAKASLKKRVSTPACYSHRRTFSRSFYVYIR